MASIESGRRITDSPGHRIAGSEDLSAVYERFGKTDLLASLVGMLAGLGTMVLLSALIAAWAEGVDYQLNVINDQGTLDEASIIGLVVAAAVVFVSFIVGGFAAGRMARYNGGMNGLGAGLWLILLVAVFAALGAWVDSAYNAFNRVDLPNWFAQVDVDDLTVMAAVASAVLVLLTLLGGYIGGRLGETYHTRVDAAIVAATRKEL
ncbi:MAG TPA: hypothetical protein VG872_09865 [Acidimicrobiia bacterium]|jgi:uncharacterized membrane protein|nr:hypothetical protein [Acidimicrobiia bacterium]